jgi:hypothetical protein
MDITIHASSLPHNADASLAFYCRTRFATATFRDPAGNLIRINELR